MSVPFGTGRSAVTSVKASRWNASPHGNDPFVAPRMLMVAPMAGEATTFCIGPDVTMAGEIESVAAPVASTTGAVTVKYCNWPDVHEPVVSWLPVCVADVLTAPAPAYAPLTTVGQF